MTDGRTAIVTGGLRGLGRAMSSGLARTGVHVVAVGHIASDIAEMKRQVDDEGLGERLDLVAADLRNPAECDRIVAHAVSKRGHVDILVNNAGLTFTYIVPDRATRMEQPRFWEISDEVVSNVIDTNFIAADLMARRVAPLMAKAGWGRVINVTTKLDTMNRRGSAPYGPSKAALEMASEIWAKDAAGTGLTVNILNPGAMADTAGLAQEIRDASHAGSGPILVQPADMVPPLLWLVSSEADQINGCRFDATTWDVSLAPGEAARRSGRLAGFVLYPVGIDG